MKTYSPELEKYILDHTHPESDLLKELNRQTHLKEYHPEMLSGHMQGKVLEMLSRMIRPRNILEIGTYTGYSAICLAQGLQEGGKLHTIEINDEQKDFIMSYFEKAGMMDKIELHIGNALEIIPTLNEKFELVFIDADKKEYLDYYLAVIDKVNPGGYIIADNVFWGGKVIKDPAENDEYTKGIMEFNDYVHNDPEVENVILPIRDGLMVLRKRGIRGIKV